MYHTAQIIQPAEGNTKVGHHDTDYLVYTISLASSDSAGVNMCPRALRRSAMERMLNEGMDMQEIAAWANPRGLSGCSGPCVTWEAGRGRTDPVREARVNLTHWLVENPRTFKAYLLRQMAATTNRNKGSRIAMRPNVDSDWKWERYCPQMFDYGWQLWDYTKLSERLGRVPANYHLTYSYNDGTLPKDWERVYKTGSNVAVVFDTVWNPWGGEFGYLPATWTDPNGKVWRVVDGDQLDLRFLDPVDVCVGLRLKGDEERREDACDAEFAQPVAERVVGSIHPADAPVGYYLGV